MVRAKFKVVRIESSQTQRRKNPDKGWDQRNLETVEMRTLVMVPVSGGSEENQRFWDASPSGELKLGTINPEAWQAFELGGEYYVDFTPAPQPVPVTEAAVGAQ